VPPDIPRVVAQSTDDPDLFSELLLAVSPELDISPTGGPFRASAKLAPLERINLFLPRLINARVRKQALQGIYTLNVPLNGPLECRVGGRCQAVEPGNAYLAGPENEVDLRIGQSTSTLAVNIAADFMDGHWLVSEPGDATPRGEPRVFSLASPGGRRLFSTLSAIWGEVLRAALPTGASLDFEDTLAEALAQALLPAEDGSMGSIKNGTQILDRAKTYIDAHLGAHLAVPDIARAAGTSNRTLHRVFLQKEGLTPMEFVTRERLNATRRVLFAAGSEGTTVTDVAFAHGFFHPGRFSLQYQNAFGERPSITLRR
jgi:AraC-like DNA-binding protein